MPLRRSDAPSPGAGVRLGCRWRCGLEEGGLGDHWQAGGRGGGAGGGSLAAWVRLQDSVPGGGGGGGREGGGALPPRWLHWAGGLWGAGVRWGGGGRDGTDGWLLKYCSHWDGPNGVGPSPRPMLRMGPGMDLHPIPDRWRMQKVGFRLRVIVGFRCHPRVDPYLSDAGIATGRDAPLSREAP